MRRGTIALFLLLPTLLLPTLLAAQGPGGEHQLRIRACVRDEAGRPLGGAGLVLGAGSEVTTAAALKSPRARSGDDGAVEYTTTLPPAGDPFFPTALIAAPGRVALQSPIRIWPSRAPAADPVVFDLGDVRLPKGHTLTGRVRDGAGQPVAGARVRAHDGLTTYAWAETTYGSRAVTDERGVFVLPGVFASAMAVAVEADGFYTRRFAWVDLGSPLDVQLAPSGFVEGTVLREDGSPFAGTATLSYEFIGVEQEPVPIEAGRFRVAVRQPCRFKVTAMSRDRSAIAESALLHGPAEGIEIRCSYDPARTFVVRAVDATTGEAIPTLRAAALWFGGDLGPDMEAWLDWSLRPSDDGGRVRMHVPRDQQEQGVVFVVAEGRAPFRQDHVQRKPGEDFVARLAAESRIEGKVVDAATGAPVAGVEVTCARWREDADPDQRPTARVRSAADGSFAFGGLGAGPHDVVARRANGTANAAQRVPLQAAAAKQDLVLELPTGVNVVGRIEGAEVGPDWRMALGEAGAPPPEDRFLFGVDAVGLRAGSSVPIVDGAFRFERRAAGTEQLWLVAPVAPRHGAPLRIPVQAVAIGAQDVELRIDLTPHRPASIAGTVTVAGVEVPRGRLAVIAVQQADDNGAWVDYDEQRRRRRWSLVAPDGSYSIPVVPGKHALEIVDVATGVVLLAESEAFDVAPGGTHRRELRVEVAAARIEFGKTPPGPLPVQRVNVLIADAEPWSGSITLFGGGQFGRAGFDLVGTDVGAPFFVPPGPVRLQLQRGATQIEYGGVTFGGDDGPGEAFDAVAGEVHTVALPLPEPSPIEGG